MCLRINQAKTDAAKADDAPEEITVYKVLVKGPTHFLVSPYWRTRYKPGDTIIAANPGRIECEKVNNTVVPVINGAGVHVYLTSRAANIEVNYLLTMGHSDITVLTLTAYKKHLVAVGDRNDAAFTELKLPETF